ncbi:MAG TPA: sugar phosphate isomerase/epimerase family protein [Terrimicrobiaceae bacterium]|nr:sugar phosphate isomerase/epimerase family protein [Terrimicrobiaceae bacterium]
MKKSVGICCFYGNWNLEEKFILAKEAGFEGFEIDLSEDGPVNLHSSEKELHAVRDLAKKHGLELSGLMSFLYWGANAASADPAQREKAGKILARQIECAGHLGVDTILVVPGAVGVDFIPGAEVVRYDTAYERATAFIRAAIPLAEKTGVTIGVENVWNKFLLSPLEMRAFVDQFGSANVGVYFDVANTLAFGYPEHWIEILGSRIKRVHFKDYRRNVATVDGFCDLLSGDVNWSAVIAALRGVGYDGWVAAEMIPPVPFYKHCPEVLIANTARAMSGILAL